MKNRTLVAVIAILVLLVITTYRKPQNESSIYFFSDRKNVTLKATIADTEETRNKGLMFVNKLYKNEGMLFIYENEQQRTFWMKDTLIPLDMIFVASNGTVVSVVENTQPCKKDPCATYQSKYPAKYVVESNAGFAKENNISAGSRLDLNHLYKTGT